MELLAELRSEKHRATATAEKVLSTLLKVQEVTEAHLASYGVPNMTDPRVIR
jgi:hypothetical protein